MTIPAWLVIGSVALGVALLCNRLTSRDLAWFNRLRRPDWLTFERLIPPIWITIFICGTWSAYLVWQQQPNVPQTWRLMAGYLLLEIAIMAYTPVMCKLRSLRVGTIIGGTGFFMGLILAIFVYPVSKAALGLLLPFLLWSPVGTYVTWVMIRLNPREM
ncbi:MAG: TspO/MBR family protein [Microcystaceae cyanobacterium]